MPGFIVHAGAAVLCLHGAPAQPTAVNTRVLVGGQPAAMLASPHAIAGCPFNPGAPSPCVTAQWTTGTTRVTSNGVPLLVQSSQAVCVPNGTPVTIGATQTRVSAL